MTVSAGSRSPPHGPAKMPTRVSGSPGDEASRGTSHPRLRQPHDPARPLYPLLPAHICNILGAAQPRRPAPTRAKLQKQTGRSSSQSEASLSSMGLGGGTQQPDLHVAPRTRPPSSAGTRRGGTDRVPHGPPPPQLQQPVVLHLGNPGRWRAFPGFTQEAPGHGPQGRLQ